MADRKDQSREVWGERAGAAVVGLAALTFVIVIGSTFWPGLMTRDSLVHYRQGFSGSYSNIFPPLGSMLMGGSGRLFGSPGPFFIAQLCAIAGAFFALARGAARSGRWVSSTLVALIAFSTPHVWSLANTLWKDIFMAAALLVALALLQRRRWIPAFACVVLAALFRHNALLAGGPLLAYATLRAYPRWRVRVTAFVVAMASLVVVPKLVEVAVGAKDVWPFGAIAAYDLGGLLGGNRALWRGSPIQQFTTKRNLARRFRPCVANRIVSDGMGIPGMQYGELVANREVLQAEWTRVVKARPDLYLRHRLETYACATGWVNPENVMKYASEGKANEFGLRWETKAPRFRWLIKQRNELHAAGLVPVPFQWGVVLAVLGVIAVATRRWLAFAAVLSGLAYAAGYVPASASAELRYFFWDIVVVFATLLLLLERRADVGAVANDAATSDSNTT